MSSFSFSHQFSQRWLSTYPPVKYAIIQELDDIATLLQPNTDLNDYEFATPNLHAHIEGLLTEERQRQEKERIETEHIEQLRQEAIRREEIKREQERQEAIRLEKEALEQQRIAREREAQAERERLEKIRLEEQAQQQAEEGRQVKFAEQREQLKAHITTDLSQHMERYIQLSLKDMLETESQKLRDELKPWLEEEVEKQLTERWTSLQNADKSLTVGTPETVLIEASKEPTPLIQTLDTQNLNNQNPATEILENETPISETVDIEATSAESAITNSPKTQNKPPRAGKNPPKRNRA